MYQVKKEHLGGFHFCKKIQKEQKSALCYDFAFLYIGIIIYRIN